MVATQREIGGRSNINFIILPPMNSLPWGDIFVDAAQLDFGSLLAEWPGLVNGQIRPIGASVFGDLFFERRSGEVEKVDVLEGGLHLVANSFRDFAALMNSRQWQERHLLTEGVALLKEKGVVRAAGQFFGFASHPSITGRIVWSTVMPFDAVVWNSICAQALSGPTSAL